MAERKKPKARTATKPNTTGPEHKKEISGREHTEKIESSQPGRQALTDLKGLVALRNEITYLRSMAAVIPGYSRIADAAEVRLRNELAEYSNPSKKLAETASAELVPSTSTNPAAALEASNTTAEDSQTAGVEPKGISSTQTTSDGNAIAKLYKGRRHGPTPDLEAACRVAAIVERVAPGGDWRAKVDDVGSALYHGVCDAANPELCNATNHERIPPPRGWSNKKCNWVRPPDRATLVKAIDYRLKAAMRGKSALGTLD